MSHMRRCIVCNEQMMPFFYQKKPHYLQGFKCTCGVWERAVSDEKQWTSNDFHNKAKTKTQETEKRSEA